MVIVVYGSDIGIAGILEVTSVLGLWTGGGAIRPFFEFIAC